MKGTVNKKSGGSENKTNSQLGSICLDLENKNETKIHNAWISGSISKTAVTAERRFEMHQGVRINPLAPEIK